ncbi:hypothetical protein [Dysgonomonas sp. BGC7]|uniref:hypothetical protein n=1 Tax=Dysgonomonas sp. BGC7 TaxID=1658008 RepID=UPI0006814C00|nr:hypothetical protein [Dysgonomonas sp. BGC7]
MKIGFLTYLLIPLMALFLSLNSCDKEENTYTKSVEGHWIYSGTKAEVYVTDPSVKQAIIDYIENRYKSYQVSYELKNDKTYYYYINYAEPLKGIYHFTSKNIYSMDDTRGVKTAVQENSTISIISDLKEDVSSILDIDESVIIKANAIDSFKRGLSSEE